MKVSLLLSQCLLCTVTCVLYTAMLVECNERLPDEMRERLGLPSTSEGEDSSESDDEDISCTDCKLKIPMEPPPCSQHAEGCIITNAFGIRQWYPEPCTLCGCYGCTEITCPHLDCFGFPTVATPGKCCPECDFGASKHNCSVVPVKIKSLYVSLGDKSCQSDIIIHGCNQRFGVEENGRLFCCVPSEIHHTHKLDREMREYTSLDNVGYMDIGKCTKRNFHSLSAREKIKLLQQLPQDVSVGREGLPQRCVEYFAQQDELKL